MSRQKLKSFTPGIGIAAGAEDAKYKAKYKELRKKVKEIEAVCIPVMVHVELFVYSCAHGLFWVFWSLARDRTMINSCSKLFRLRGIYNV